MKKAQEKASGVEQRCPACQGLFTINPASRKKKVQCPQCRGVVLVGEFAEEEVPADPGAPPPAWVTRCEMLQARIEALEHQLEALMISPRGHGSLLPERLPDFHSRDRDRPAEEETADPTPAELPPREFSRVVENSLDMPAAPPADPPAAAEPAESPEPDPAERFMRLIQLATPRIGLLIATGDHSARRVAESLSPMLARAGWEVPPIAEDATVPPDHSGLTFVAAPTLPVQRVTSTLNALRDAGFCVAFQLDPARGPSEAALLIGTATAPG